MKAIFCYIAITIVAVILTMATVTDIGNWLIDQTETTAEAIANAGR